MYQYQKIEFGLMGALTLAITVRINSAFHFKYVIRFQSAIDLCVQDMPGPCFRLVD